MSKTSKRKIKITANVDPFNYQPNPDVEPILVRQGTILEVEDNDPFYQRYKALGWLEEVEEGEIQPNILEEAEAITEAEEEA